MAEKILSKIIGGKYRLRSLLGRGAMGIVYRAEQLDVEGYPLREVALKMMLPELSLDPGFSQRFLREVRAAARLRSPHTVMVYDSGKDEEEQLYYTMELVQGTTLEEILRHQGTLPIERVVNIAGQICEALFEAHSLPSQPLVHRDLKPANIFLEERQGQEWAKVGDFGTAKVIGDDVNELTQSGAIIGTFSYMAPEQWLGKEVDHRADLYALGIILYRMLSGRKPFSAVGDIEALREQHLYHEPPPFAASIPAGIRALVKELLAKDLKGRPADARRVRRVLEAALGREEKEEESTVLLSTGEAAAPSCPVSSPSGDVFISYASRDRARVLEIVNTLESAGVWVCLDRSKANEDTNSGPETVRNIEVCKVLLVMCSNASLRSRTVKAEMQLAWKYQRPYLPLLLEPTSFPEQLAYWREGGQWIDVAGLPADQWLPLVLRSLEHVSVPLHAAAHSGVQAGPIVQPTVPEQGLRGLQLVGKFTDQIWPLPADPAQSRPSRSAFRDLGVPQDDVQHGYRLGDRVSLAVELERAGHLLVLNEGTTGKIYCLCPSWFAPDTRVQPGRVYLPQEGSRYRAFEITGKPGREHLLAIITGTPLGLDWLPTDSKSPARVLTPADIDVLLTRLHSLEGDQWTALSTYFDVTA